MTAVDPAAFIVRSGSFPQSEIYPITCSEITQELLDRGDAVRTVDDLVVAIAAKLKEKKPHPRQRREGDEDYSYAVLHPLDSGIYRSSVCHEEVDPGGDNRAQLMESLEKDWDERLPRIWIKRIKHRDLELTTFHHYPRSGELRMLHPPMDENKTDAPERRWHFIREAFNRAISQGAQEEREKATKECFWWLCQDMPMLTGSDTMARIALEYMAHRIGFTVPFVKEKRSLNRYAQSSSLEDFLEGWSQGSYFDKDANSEKILQWQRDYIKDKPLESPTL